MNTPSLSLLSSRGGSALFLGLTAASLLLVFVRHEYLPLIDWSNHLGLIDLFRRKLAGEDLECVAFGVIPGPYFGFYFVSAVLGALVQSTLVGAKVALALSLIALYPAGRRFCQAVNTEPTLAVLGPLAGFGFAFGYGFASFCFSLPFFVWALALLLDDAEDRQRDRLLGGLVVPALLISHGVAYLGFCVIAGLVAHFETLRCPSIGPYRRTFLVILPSAVLAVGMLVIAGGPEAAAASGVSVAEFRHLGERLSEWRGDLLERGDQRFLLVMYAFSLVVLALVCRAYHHRSPSVPLKAWIPGGFLVLLYLLGPETIFVPVEVWKISTRFATMAVLLLVLCIPVRLDPGARSALWVAGLALNLSMYGLLDEVFGRFDRSVAGYAEVRTLVRSLERVPSVGGFTAWNELPAEQRHPAVTSLYFYHVLDGARFTPYLFNNRLLPIVRGPGCPVDRGLPGSVLARRLPEVLVLRGQAWRRGIQRLPFDEVGVRQGWYVFRRRPAPESLDTSLGRE